MVLFGLNSILDHPYVVYSSVEAINIVEELVYIIAVIFFTLIGIFLHLLVSLLLVICLFYLPRAIGVGCASLSRLLRIKCLLCKHTHQRDPLS